MEYAEDELKKRLVKIWQSRKFQMFIDVCRIIMAITAIIILVVLIKEIDAVKILSLNVCDICIEKTGCSCWCS